MVKEILVADLNKLFTILIVIFFSSVLVGFGLSDNKLGDVNSVIGKEILITSIIQKDLVTYKSAYQWNYPNQLRLIPISPSDSIIRLLPVVNLEIEPDKLFSPFNGVLGIGVYQLKSRSFGTEWYRKPANYSRLSKKARKVAAKATIEDVNGNRISVYGKIRPGGNSSRAYAQKSFKLYLKDDLDITLEQKHFSSARYYLRCGGNEWNRSLIKDAVIQNASINEGVFAQQNTWIHLFLNDSYWGLYTLRNRVYDEFINKQLSGRELETTVKYSRLDKGDTSGFEFFRDFDEKLNGSINKELVDLVVSHIDIENFFNYLAIEILTANNDWPDNNEDILVTKDKKGNRAFFWVLKDLDKSFMEGPEDTFDRLCEAKTFTGKVFNVLITDDELRKRFIEKVSGLYSDNFKARLLMEYQKQFESIKPHLKGQHNRWRYSTEEKQLSHLAGLERNISSISGSSVKDRLTKLGSSND